MKRNREETNMSEVMKNMGSQPFKKRKTELREDNLDNMQNLHSPISLIQPHLQISQMQNLPSNQNFNKNFVNNSKTPVVSTPNQSKGMLKTTEKIMSVLNNLKGTGSSPSNKPTSSKIKIENSCEKSFYIENRLNSMSHIKLINSKYRNSIIPVLPGAFNKN
jgi:hypothetical protein